MTARLLLVWLLLPCQFGLVVTGCSGYMSDDASLEACNGIAADARSQRLKLQGNAERACERDEDCVVVDYPLTCVAGCRFFSAVSRAAEPELASSVQDVEDVVCPDFFERGCKLGTKTCPPPLSAAVVTCDDGLCILRTAQP